MWVKLSKNLTRKCCSTLAGVFAQPFKVDAAESATWSRLAATLSQVCVTQEAEFTADAECLQSDSDTLQQYRLVLPMSTEWLQV